jgi:hypothetical protein
MGTSPEPDLRELVEFASEQLNNGGSELTPEEVLDLWRAEHPTAAELAESVATIEQALAQADRGEGLPLDEFDRQFRSRHGLDPLDQ